MKVQHLIVAGSTKCGTTTLHNLLSADPQFCCGSRKEVDFFLSSEELKLANETELESILNFEKTSLKDGYARCFPDSGAIKLDVSPQYMYSPHFSDRLRESGVEAQVLFLFRRPSKRVESIYKYSRYKEWIGHEVDFDGFLNSQVQLDEQNIFGYPMHLNALNQSRYSWYFSRMAEIGNPRVFFLEELEASPDALIEKVGDLLGVKTLDRPQTELRSNASFVPRSVVFASAYRRFVRLAKFANEKLMFGALGGVEKFYRQSIHGKVLMWNAASSAPVCSSAWRLKLDELDAQEGSDLLKLSGVCPPWYKA